ncbi:LacI family DNA-binding transcriptional regulator [Clostridium sp. MCC353]|uniref:LacI family DNA-binding transcriptional regulator n=1 Tax=Clostridium sp. MCC353 TaxID=2592646 RepID=UPI001C016A63|nr:LacI family DNA-binding transcriptional regulator [Clostridium sp. MCC353]MBT9775184.1 LacI family DNA-binding transcriptional regulator [Clostridium sp. MCC353]
MDQITIKEVAKLCGVGISTVSRAINNHPDINAETKKKIMRVIEEQNYIPNNSARNLKRVESKMIVVLMKGITNPFFNRMIKIFENRIVRYKYSILIHHVDEEEDEVTAALRLEKEKKPGGMIFLGGKADHEEEKLKSLKAPFVMCACRLNPDIDKTLYSSVSIDDVNASYEMVSHLISQGHRRIAIAAARKEDTAVGKMRLAGYKKALADHNIPYREELVIHQDAETDAYSMSGGYSAAKRFLESGAGATAIFAISDVTAFGVCRALADAGKMIPGDISVAGFDGIEMAEYYCPSLTTMKQPCDQMALESVELLFDLMDGRCVNKQIVFEAQLVTGESTAAVMTGGKR